MNLKKRKKLVHLKIAELILSWLLRVEVYIIPVLAIVILTFENTSLTAWTDTNRIGPTVQFKWYSIPAVSQAIYRSACSSSSWEYYSYDSSYLHKKNKNISYSRDTTSSDEMFKRVKHFSKNILRCWYYRVIGRWYVMQQRAEENGRQKNRHFTAITSSQPLSLRHLIYYVYQYLSTVNLVKG